MIFGLICGLYGVLCFWLGCFVHKLSEKQNKKEDTEKEGEE